MKKQRKYAEPNEGLDRLLRPRASLYFLVLDRLFTSRSSSSSWSSWKTAFLRFRKNIEGCIVAPSHEKGADWRFSHADWARREIFQLDVSRTSRLLSDAKYRGQKTKTPDFGRLPFLHSAIATKIFIPRAHKDEAEKELTGLDGIPFHP